MSNRSLLARLFLGVDRKSTRLNSSHLGISYAVFCFAPPCDRLSFPTRRSSDLGFPIAVSTRQGFSGLSWHPTDRDWPVVELQADRAPAASRDKRPAAAAQE